MATYIQGLTDYIPQIQPFQPDLNFFANVMQTRQNKYDIGKKKINSLYGSLLNSPLSREDSVRRRDEFFKMIDQDIKKISGLDLSKEQNVDAALNVFQGFYEDDLILKDMSTTKKLQNQLQTAEGYKNCKDPEKCNGVYWDEGVKKLQYQMEDFKNMSAKDAMGFSLDSYEAYVPWKEKAMKLVMEKGFNASKTDVSGDWVVTDTNGDVVKGGLYGLFKSVYGDDPRIQSNYQTKAYVDMKDNVRAGINIYGSEEESQKAYVTSVYTKGLSDLSKQLKQTTDDYDQVNNVVLELERKKNNKGKLSDYDQQLYNMAVQKRTELDTNKKELNNTLTDITSDYNKGDVKYLINKALTSNAFTLQVQDMNNLAESLSKRGMERKVVANPYGEISAKTAARKSEMAYESSLNMKELEYKNVLAKDLASYNFAIDLEKMKTKHGYDTDVASIKKGVANGTIPAPGGNFEEGLSVEATPGSTVSLGLEDNPELLYQRTNVVAEMKNEAESKNGAVNYLYDVFNEAKNNAKNNNGAEQYLKNTYGDNWNSIKNPQDLLVAINKKKGSGGYYAVFNNTNKMLDSKSNPLGDVSWSDSVIMNNKERVYNIKKSHDTYIAKVTNAINATKQTIDKIKKSATTDNKVASYADLLISKGGIYLGGTEDAPAGFVKGYIEREMKAGNYDVDAGDAQDAYETLQEQFYTTYNTTAQLTNTGIGLSGGGVISSGAVKYEALDLKKPGAVSADVINTMSEALRNDNYKIVTGNNSLDNYEEDNNEYAQRVIQSLITTARSGSEKDKPTIAALLSGIAAEKENVSSITVNIPKDYLDKVLGSKDKGPEADAKAKILKDGITLFFNNTITKSDVIKGSQMSNTELIIRSGVDHTVDAYSDYGGTITYKNYDKARGTVSVVATQKYISNGKLTEEKTEYQLPISKVGISEQNHLEAFKLQSQKNYSILNK